MSVCQKSEIFYQEKGRESDEEFIYFNSVGLSYIDLNFAHEIYREASLLGLGRDIVLAESDRVDYRCFIKNTASENTLSASLFLSGAGGKCLFKRQPKSSFC